MDPDNPVVKLCVEITQAEFAGRLEDARALAARAWRIANDDYEACIAAHYVARFQQAAGERLRWDQVALERADRTRDGRVAEFYPSLYLNLGHAHEQLGHDAEAQRYYRLAAERGAVHHRSAISEKQ